VYGISNALRNDLQHPNEYIRGATLRFLCKIKEADVLEPLVPSVRSCLVCRQLGGIYIEETNRQGILGTSSLVCSQERGIRYWIDLPPL
jgi:hypothetical protein